MILEFKHILLPGPTIQNGHLRFLADKKYRKVLDWKLGTILYNHLFVGLPCEDCQGA